MKKRLFYLAENAAPRRRLLVEVKTLFPLFYLLLRKVGI